MATIQQIGLFSDSDTVTLRKEREPRECVGRFLMLGAGVQSSVLAEMIVEGELPRVDAAVFADTGDEPAWVYGQVWYLAGRLDSVGIPLHMVRNGDLSLSEAARVGHGRFASMPLFTKDEAGKISMLRRQCTNEFKIVPGDGFVKDWLIARGYAKSTTDKNGRVSRRVSRDVEVHYLLGYSLDEWSRMKPDKVAWKHKIYPLIDQRITRMMCEDWLKARGLPVPHKSACIQCPFHDDDYWRWLADFAPATFEESCLFDDWLRTPKGKAALHRIHDEVYLHSSCEPLRTVDFTGEKANPMDILLCGESCMT